MSFRRVRSPEAPKIMIVQGSMFLFDRSVFSFQGLSKKGCQRLRKSVKLLKKPIFRPVKKVSVARRAKNRRVEADERMGCWSMGALECGVLNASLQYSTTPILQSSILDRGD
jgi:hypothetical protein